MYTAVAVQIHSPSLVMVAVHYLSLFISFSIYTEHCFHILLILTYLLSLFGIVSQSINNNSFIYIFYFTLPEHNIPIFLYFLLLYKHILLCQSKIFLFFPHFFTLSEQNILFFTIFSHFFTLSEHNIPIFQPIYSALPEQNISIYPLFSLTCSLYQSINFSSLSNYIILIA